MANKRMFSMNIVNSDIFLSLPPTAQNLYFHLGMRADDDGFLGNAKRLAAYIGSSNEDLELLIKNRFLLSISGVVVIKHWRMHNTILKDRYTPTVYQDEYKMLTLKSNKSYTEIKQNVTSSVVQNDNGVVQNVNVSDNTNDNTNDNGVVQNDNVNDNGSVIQSDSKSVVSGDVIQNVNTGLDLDLDLGLEKHIVHSGEMHGVESDELELFYESIWKLYPLKKGKEQVSKAAKKKLLKIGFDETARAIERYKADLEKDKDWRKPQNGSTFFNSGYVDYLDTNYQPSKEKTTLQNAKQNLFHSFPQRERTKEEYDEIEKRILEKQRGQSSEEQRS